MKAFRTIHYVSIAAFAGALVHGLYAGTDSALDWTQLMYRGSFLRTVFLGVYWLVFIRLQKWESSEARISAQKT